MNILFYLNSHNKGLGHTNTANNIVDYLEDNHDVIVVEGGFENEHAQFEEYEVLPHPEFRIEKNLEEKGKSKKEKLKDRISSFNDIIDENELDVFITETFPFFRKYEYPLLKPIIKKVKESNTKVVCTTGWPAPLFNEKLFSMFKLYDLFLFNCLELDIDYILRELNERDSIFYSKYKKFISNLGHKIVFTGYVIEDVEPDNTYDVVISRGGGGREDDFILKAGEFAKSLSERVLLTAGPFTKDWMWSKLNEKFRDVDNIDLVKYEPKLSKYIAGCNVSINMGGYNTSMILLKHGIKSVTVPRKWGRDMPLKIEEIARSKMMNDLIETEIVLEKDVSVSNIKKGYESIIDKDVNKVSSDNFEGEVKIEDSINDLF